jgi:predicted SnoaL-like aldol condensation-catalyzing enzyme
MEPKSNKTIVLECYRKIIRDLDLALIPDYIHDDYIQHSPTVKDGRAGITEMLMFMKSMPRPAEPSLSPIIRVIADGDFVAVHLDVKFMDKRMAVVDLMRLCDGKMAEHWDAGQLQPEPSDSTITMTNGSTIIEDSVNAEKSKAVVKAFFDNIENAAEYLTPGFIEHNPDNGLSSFAGSEIKIQHVLGEGNFVVVHFGLAEAGKSMACFSIFKLEDDKIAGHWGVQQDIPAAMAHGNGMF